MTSSAVDLVDVCRILDRANLRRFLEETARFYGSRLAILGPEREIVLSANGLAPEPGDREQARRTIRVRDRLIGHVITSPIEAGDGLAAHVLATHVTDLLADFALREYELNDLSREILDSYEEVNLFYDLSSALGGARDVPEICTVILDKALEIIKAERASILLLDERGRELQIAAAAGIPVSQWERVRIRIGNGISGQVFESRTPRLVDDVAHLPRGLLTGYEKYATSSFVSVPLLLDHAESSGPRGAGAVAMVDPAIPLEERGRAIGVLNLTDKAAGESFTSSDLKLLTALASQAAVLIENFRLMELEKEMRVARKIQRSLLPDTPPNVPGMDMAGVCRPARNVGGDYYDFVCRGEGGSVAILIADVSGHNLASAMMMAVGRSALRAEVRRCEDPGLVIERANRFLYEDLTRAELFLSIFCAVIDPELGTLQFAGAGHPAGILLRRDGEVETLESGGLLVGVLDEVSCSSETISVEPGDILLLYTDGIVECRQSDGTFFGSDRLVGALVAHGKSGDASAAQILDGIFEDVFSFLGDPPQSDDMTAVVLKVMATRGR